MFFTPIPADEATSIQELRKQFDAAPENTSTGVVCGGCTQIERKHGDLRAKIRHASVAHVRYCFAINYEADAAARSEQDAEMAIERYLEGGWDITGTYLAESLLTAGGQIALS